MPDTKRPLKVFLSHAYAERELSPSQCDGSNPKP
jgi:hypothetical protein